MVRVIASLCLSLVVALALVIVMSVLVVSDSPQLTEAKPFKLPEFAYVPVEETLETLFVKPDRPSQPDEQPELAAPQFRADNIALASNISVGAVRVGINKDLNKSFNEADGEYLPIFKAPAVYPRRAQERGKCGWVIVEFTVTTSGAVRDPVVIESSSKIFENSAKRAALKFKYKPRKVGGKTVEVPNVRNKISYEIEGGCRNAS